MHDHICQLYFDESLSITSPVIQYSIICVGTNENMIILNNI